MGEPSTVLTYFDGALAHFIEQCRASRRAAGKIQREGRREAHRDRLERQLDELCVAIAKLRLRIDDDEALTDGMNGKLIAQVDRDDIKTLDSP